MIKLPQVTLICMTGLGYKTQEHIDALKKSYEGIKFADTKLIQLGSIVDIGTWNEAIIRELPKYIETTHCLLIHEDSEILNPDLWDDEWLSLDFIGSPWPLPRWKGEFEDTLGRIQRVGNSVSLRSKKLMDLVATRPVEYHFGNNNEDGMVCIWERVWLENQGCKFATFEQALKFGKEVELPENKGLETFLIHKV
jgi:hypothetical protein